MKAKATRAASMMRRVGAYSQIRPVSAFIARSVLRSRDGQTESQGILQLAACHLKGATCCYDESHLIDKGMAGRCKCRLFVECLLPRLTYLLASTGLSRLREVNKNILTLQASRQRAKERKVMRLCGAARTWESPASCGIRVSSANSKRSIAWRFSSKALQMAASKWRHSFLDGLRMRVPKIYPHALTLAALRVAQT